MAHDTRHIFHATSESLSFSFVPYPLQIKTPPHVPSCALSLSAPAFLPPSGAGALFSSPRDTHKTLATAVDKMVNGQQAVQKGLAQHAKTNNHPEHMEKHKTWFRLFLGPPVFIHRDGQRRCLLLFIYLFGFHIHKPFLKKTGKLPPPPPSVVCDRDRFVSKPKNVRFPRLASFQRGGSEFLSMGIVGLCGSEHCQSDVHSVDASTIWATCPSSLSLPFRGERTLTVSAALRAPPHRL